MGGARKPLFCSYTVSISATGPLLFIRGPENSPSELYGTLALLTSFQKAITQHTSAFCMVGARKALLWGCALQKPNRGPLLFIREHENLHSGLYISLALFIQLEKGLKRHAFKV